MTTDGVVLVHGSNLTAACWDAVIGHLAVPAVAIDLPGRGSRPADIVTVTLDDCVDAVIESARQAGFTRFVLVGHSLGGVVITEGARRIPNRVAALVYVGALVPAPGMNAASIMFGDDLPTADPRTTTEDRAKLFFASGMTDDQWDEVWRHFVPESPLLWNARLTGFPDDVPITYVSMVDDVGVPPALAEQMIANAGTNVTHQVLSAGHLVMVTKPLELANAINQAIDR
ncbi:hypothetical protein A5662_10880 [Mycobacteriaceae bacterium 1482268.1]|nr:hypothetical protein A5662_10880 [Mycobacteriaceae bacterium 1482268.1]